MTEGKLIKISPFLVLVFVYLMSLIIDYCSVEFVGGRKSSTPYFISYHFEF